MTRRRRKVTALVAVGYVVAMASLASPALRTPDARPAQPTFGREASLGADEGVSIGALSKAPGLPQRAVTPQPTQTPTPGGGTGAGTSSGGSVATPSATTAGPQPTPTPGSAGDEPINTGT